jgi:MarR family transcriptional regulator, 2-MHQ and catechol-resistance regulon repressor
MIAQPTTPGATGAELDGGEQSRALKLWVVLARAHAAIARHAEADAAVDGLTLAEFAILESLLHKGRLRLGELQQTVLVTSGGTTYLVDRLAARGLVRRAECPEDRRVRYAELTAAGETLVRAAFARHAERIRRAVAGLTPAEQEVATRLLRTLGRAAAAEGSAPAAA